MKRLTHYLTALASCTLLLTGCGSSSSDGEAPREPVADGQLRRLASAAELEASLKAGLTAIEQPDPRSSAVGGDAGRADFTGTYTQEANVDEFDTVRYDGEHLFIAPMRFANCCHVFTTQTTAPSGTPPAAVPAIRIMATDPNTADVTLQASIPLEDEVTVQGMYVGDDQLIALTSRRINGTYGGFWDDLVEWLPDALELLIYDTADPENPVLAESAHIEGVFVDSRRIGDTIYLITRYTPEIEGLAYPVNDAADQAANEAILANVSLATMLPTITINGNEQSLVEPTQCLSSSDRSSGGYPVITSITAFPVGNPAAFSTTCYNEASYGVYVSEQSIYLTQRHLDDTAQSYATQVHKFGLDNITVDYRGSIEVPGEVWTGGQLDFRLSEANGDLRMLSTVYTADTNDSLDHHLYVVREKSGSPGLELVGELPNVSRPEEIGKPNEQLYGVRFIDNRAYIVTFKQIDPLYVLNLANPEDPTIAGQLEVTGFSDFLHPVSDDLLLGLGEDASGGIKLELFDVSQVAQPLSRGSLTLGGRGSSSEARYDRHAFTYQSDVDGVDRFTIPAYLLATDNSFEFVESGLYLFEIRDKMTPNLASLISVGSMSIVGANGGIPVDGTSRNRAYLNGDSVFYVRDNQVWSAFWTMPDGFRGPF